jgi:hypothetical protein
MNKIRTIGGAADVPPAKTTAAVLPILTAMQPFLELPMCIQHEDENKEIQEKDVIVRIQPSEIAYYYPGFYWGVVVVMKSGSSYLLKMELQEFDQALAGYHSAVTQKPTQFGNLSIQPKPKIHGAN